MRRLALCFTIIMIWLAALLLAGCGGSAPAAQAPTAGVAAQALPLRNEILKTIDQVGRPELFQSAWDATPDPDGKNIYFTATGRFGSGVFKVPAGGGTVVEMLVGKPFVSPLGLAISGDGQRIYVADSQASGADGRMGRVFVIPAGGGEPMTLAGTEGTAPRGVEVASEQGTDTLYFSGVDPSARQPAVMKIAAAGSGPVSVIAKGAPLIEPGGIAVTKSGVVYVADRLASGNDMGSVFRINGAAVEPIASNFRTGNPVVGATLTQDESALLVSALAPDRDSAQVLLIELPSLQKAIVNKVIEANPGAGGVHRAHNRNVFAWAGSTLPRSVAGGSHAGGGVYFLSP